MSEQPTPPEGPDLTRGVLADSLTDGAMIAGRVGDEAVLLTRVGDEFLAVGAVCTHYSGPLPEGLMVGDTIRCPWHHACFSLRTGNAIRAPALRPLARWRVERRNQLVVVTEKIEAPDPELGVISESKGRKKPESVVIVGFGAAGSAAAETLRREGYAGKITAVDRDQDAPYDRPNLSKDYLAGTAEEEWLPLRSAEFYRDHGIERLQGPHVVRIDAKGKRVFLSDGAELRYDALLLATGSDPIRLPLEARQPVRYLRTLRDSRDIIAAAGEARRAVVLGASFIGLEVAASLRNRGLEVHVVAPEQLPLERVLGPELGEFVKRLHQEHGVVFHLGRTAAAVEEKLVRLDNGEGIEAGLVVAGVGVRLTSQLAADAGLAGQKGVDVDQFLETSVPGIYAAGDIAFWPDPHTGDRIHVEHWVVAQRQGQTAARNILGAAQPFDAVPFFWSSHYDVSISYVGHAQSWDRIGISGNVGNRDATVTFYRGDLPLAVATIGRDRGSLMAEVALEGTRSPSSPVHAMR
jgi:apoptosis-inducing factor 3